MDMNTFKCMVVNVYSYLQIDMSVNLPITLVCEIFESIQPIVDSGININRPACFDYH